MGVRGRRLLKKIGSAFSIFLLAVSILFQNQCYSGAMAASLICSCNHSSPTENHSDDIILSSHKGLSQSNDPSLPDCHRPKLSHSSHECTCKKGETRKKMISALYQMNLIKNEIIFIFSLPERTAMERQNFHYKNLFSKNHFRPPEISSSVSGYEVI